MKQTVHFIGIGGIGMSGLAHILLQKGASVSGSDVAASYTTENLEKLGARVFIGHQSAHIASAETVVYSTDIPKENPELAEALKKKCKVMHRSDLLLALMQDTLALAVTGTHGKTTTSSLLVHVLHTAKMDPTFAVGGIIPSFSTNAALGKGKYFVVEADESDATFLKYPYHGAIVTNIDNDHLAHYGSMEALIEAFSTFVKKAPHKELLFFCGDDPILASMDPEGVSYGFGKDVQLRAVKDVQRGWSSFFDIEYKGKTLSHVELALSGRHNILNALAVFGLADALGIDESTIRLAFKTFSGVKRRLEKKADVHGVLVLDDYAHHPVEIAATLDAVKRSVFGRRIVAVYQPHRYSRMRYCMDSFTSTFAAADEVIVTDLYTANEEKVAGVETKDIIAAIASSNKRAISYVPRNAVIETVHRLLRPHDVVVFLGAGDITKAASEYASYLQKHGVRKLSVGVIYGGMNSEHEVSCISKDSIAANLSQDFYQCMTFCIEKDGRFTQKGMKKSDSIVSQEVFEALMECDLFLPVLHGPFGEDGTIQGFFETLGKPYVGCDVRSCALSMDKAFTKWVAQANDILTSPFYSFSYHDWHGGREAVLSEIKQRLSFPLFVKPSHLGSTVGVSRVTDADGLIEAVDRALECDTHVLVEREIRGREIEFAVMGNGDVRVANPGEILTQGKVYTYDAKYSSDGFQVTVEPDLPEEVIAKGKRLAEKMYRLASCQGLSRIDFFLDADYTFWLNEINPFPGFTKNSLYPKMWERSGIPYDALLDQLIILALERKRIQDRHFAVSK